MSESSPVRPRPVRSTPKGASYRRLVRCGGCYRQFDAGELAPGAHFHCHCGATLAVPRTAPQEAPVVRCASCGAPRAAGAEACTFCTASFVLGEAARNTLCPLCANRIGDAQRYCHGCGTPIAPEAVAGEPTELSCPACTGPRTLTGRRMADATTPLAMLECSACAGIWLGHRTFDTLQERARREAPPASLARRAQKSTGSATTPRKKIAYRPCPVCTKLMVRRNFGGSSGVVLDLCGADGLWFDAAELDDVLAWIRGGGLARAGERELEERRELVRREALTKKELREVPPPEASEGHWLDLLSELVDFVLDSVARR